MELRAEMNVLAILNTCQHPLDPNPKYAPKPVQLSIRRVPPPAAGRSLPRLAARERTRLHSDGTVFPMTDRK